MWYLKAENGEKVFKDLKERLLEALFCRINLPRSTSSVVTSGCSEPPDYCQASLIPALCLTVPSCMLDDLLPLKSV